MKDDSKNFIKQYQSTYSNIPTQTSPMSTKVDASELMQKFYFPTFGAKQFFKDRIDLYEKIVNHVSNTNYCLGMAVKYDIDYAYTPGTKKSIMYVPKETNFYNNLDKCGDNIFIIVGTERAVKHAILVFVTISNREINLLMFDSEVPQDEKMRNLHLKILQDIYDKLHQYRDLSRHNVKYSYVSDYFVDDVCYLQTKAENELCSVWSAYFLYLIIMNPEKNVGQILQYMNKGNKRAVHDRLVDFMFFVLCDIAQFNLCKDDSKLKLQVTDLYWDYDGEEPDAEFCTRFENLGIDEKWAEENKLGDEYKTLKELYLQC